MDYVKVVEMKKALHECDLQLRAVDRKLTRLAEAKGRTEDRSRLGAIEEQVRVANDEKSKVSFSMGELQTELIRSGWKP